MSSSLHIQLLQNKAGTQQFDVVVLGAGPYGLSIAAHLRERGLGVAVFGKPLGLWRDHMPQGMLLRSFWWASNLSDPHRQYDFSHYFQHHHLRAHDPLARDTFIDYGLWFQRQAVADVDETYVKTVRQREDQFEVELVDGRMLHSSAVVMAPGLAYYAYRPPEYDHLPAELVSHTADHSSFAHFAGQRVVVVGGGQSALETAALLQEQGAQAHVVSRSPLRWLQQDSLQNRSVLEKLRRPQAGIAPGWFNWGLEHFPYAFQKLPRSAKEHLLRGRGSYGPAGSWWLKERILDKVTLHEVQQVRETKEVDNGVAVLLSNNRRLQADHVILGTGYRMDISKLPMLHPLLLANIRTDQDAPVLSHQFESSVAGLYFVGFSSVRSCGPFYRFVVGTEATARRVTHALARRVALLD